MVRRLRVRQASQPTLRSASGRARNHTETFEVPPACDKVMDAYYCVPFRVGGTGPGMRLLIGAWAELGEEPIPIDLYVCPQCGRMEQFGNKKTRDRLSRARVAPP